MDFTVTNPISTKLLSVTVNNFKIKLHIVKNYLCLILLLQGSFFLMIGSLEVRETSIITALHMMLNL